LVIDLCRAIGASRLAHRKIVDGLQIDLDASGIWLLL
jgi:hypothetical protein